MSDSALKVGDLVYMKRLIDSNLSRFGCIPKFEVSRIESLNAVAIATIGASVNNNRFLPIDFLEFVDDLIKVDNKETLKAYLQLKVSDINSFIEGLG